MLHGHAKIELTNVKTGEKQIIEHDNMLTNYWRDMFTPKGICGRNFLQTGIAWDKHQFFGGILLFENALNDNADDYRFPHGNKMIAHGSNIAYSGVDTLMGSFNEAESTFGDDSATLVWDWTQERGNGTISALGLTSAEGGLIGAGRDNNGDTSDDYIIPINAHQTSNNANMGGANGYNPVYMDEVNNRAYAAYVSSNNLYIREYQFEASGIDLLTALTVSNSGNNVPQYDITRRVDTTISLASFGWGSNATGFTYQGKLYITGASNWGSGARTFARYDFATGVLDSVTITNNTGETINLTTYQLARAGFIIHDGCLYAVTTSMHIVYINLSDNTDCGTVKDGDGNVIVRANNNGYSWIVLLWGEVIFNKGQMYGNGKGDANQKQMYVLESKGVAKRRGLAMLNAGYYGLHCSMGYALDNGNYARGYFAACENGNIYSVYNMMCLATKNNLQTPVTKTADMTMRVTYTIQEVTE